MRLISPELDEKIAIIDDFYTKTSQNSEKNNLGRIFFYPFYVDMAETKIVFSQLVWSEILEKWVYDKQEEKADLEKIHKLCVYCFCDPFY